MQSIGIKPKAGRIIIVALCLLYLIWVLGYFDPLATASQFPKLPGPPQGDIPEYPKIEDLTAAAEAHDRSKLSKSWFFGATGDGTVGVAESKEWFRLWPFKSATQADVSTKTKDLVDAASVIASSSAGIDIHTGSDSGSFEEYVAPANTSAQRTTASPMSNALPSPIPEAKPSLALEHFSEVRPAERPASRPLILYAYSPASWALPNLNFFLKHGLHGSAMFVFIINGALVPISGNDATPLAFTNSTDEGVWEVLSVLEPYAEKYPNIRIWKRPNTCYDLGAYAEVLKANSSALVRLYKKFILINASLRGPFVPFWSQDCWSDAYLRLIDDKNADSNNTNTRPVKLVGMTINCVNVRPRHVQSMLLATDRTGLKILLGQGNETFYTTASTSSNVSSTKYTNTGIDACPTSMDEAVNIEVSLTPLIQSYNYTVRAMMAEYWSKQDYELDCTNGDVNAGKGAYEGGDLGVFETLFIKTRWAVEANQTERLTRWYDGAFNSGMSKGAWDKCGKIS